MEALTNTLAENDLFLALKSPKTCSCCVSFSPLFFSIFTIINQVCLYAYLSFKTDFWGKIFFLKVFLYVHLPAPVCVCFLISVASLSRYRSVFLSLSSVISVTLNA